MNFGLYSGFHFGLHFVGFILESILSSTWEPLKIQLDAFGIPGGHHLGVKWWVHQKTVRGAVLCP